MRTSLFPSTISLFSPSLSSNQPLFQPFRSFAFPFLIGSLLLTTRLGGLYLNVVEGFVYGLEEGVL